MGNTTGKGRPWEGGTGGGAEKKRKGQRRKREMLGAEKGERGEEKMKNKQSKKKPISDGEIREKIKEGKREGQKTESDSAK